MFVFFFIVTVVVVAGVVVAAVVVVIVVVVVASICDRTIYKYLGVFLLLKTSIFRKNIEP